MTDTAGASISDPPSRDAILEYLAEQKAPVTADELAVALGVDEPAIIPLRRRLAAMQRDGQILQNRKGALMQVSRLDLVAGRVSSHRDGYGFVLPDDKGSGPDIFLSPREMQKVMHGDRVLVRKTGSDSRGRVEGTIVEVTERLTRTVVGRLLNERGVLLVVPEDQRIKHDILLQPGEAAQAEPGKVVSVEIIEPPGVNKPPIGRIVEVLGEIDDPGMEIEIAVRKFEVPHQFTEAALQQAAELPEELRAADYRRRVDLRDVPLVTIDGEDARDFDDAVYCEPMEPGKPQSGWRLLVAIADVSHYVTPASALDEDAQRRTTSVYFPRRVIPMLPEKLSNGLCSINPQVDRAVLVADMVVDGKGRMKAYQFYPAVMRSHARLTYNQVWGVLSGGDPLAAQQLKPLRAQLDDLHALFRQLLVARNKRGAMDFDTVETKILCDPAGRIQSIVAVERNDAHRLIEECMLSANTCAADFLLRNRHPGLFRVHEGPTPEKLARLRTFLTGAGLKLGSAGEDPTPADYARLAQEIAGRPDHSLLQTMMLRSMQQAIYTPINSGHFGLSYEGYAHFTSPIRRYPDLLNHRAIRALLDDGRYVPQVLDSAAVQVPARSRVPVQPPTRAADRATTRAMGDDAGAQSGAAPAAAAAAGARPARRTVKPKAPSIPADSPEAMQAWEQLGTTCSVNERRADDATRDVEAWLKCQYMRERVGDQYRGRITGVAPFGVFVTLEALYVEGMVHVSELGSEYFQYNEASSELRGERTGLRYRLTDPIDVQVSRVDLEGRRIEFRLVSDRGDARGEGRKDARGDGRGGPRESRESRESRDAGAPRDAQGQAGRPAGREAEQAGPDRDAASAPARPGTKTAAGRKRSGQRAAPAKSATVRAAQQARKERRQKPKAAVRTATGRKR